MTPTEQAQQLRLAARIIETEHPFEVRYPRRYDWCAVKHICPSVHVVNKCEIRPVLATPPDGRPLHNPDNLTAEQVGLGYRLALQDESASQPHEAWEQNKWRSAILGPGPFGSYLSTYRLPLSVPWPEAPKPDPYAETTKQVELGPEDVPPGSVIRPQYWDGPPWMAVSKVCINDCLIEGKAYTWEMLKSWQINRSIPLTGKWDATAWEPCHKPKPLANG